VRASINSGGLMKGPLVSYAAIHEAAHAVVAVHVRVPFHYVTIHPRRVDGGWEDGHIHVAHKLRIRLYMSDGRGGFRPRTEAEAQATRERYITNVAVVALGVRAFCVSSYISFKQANGKAFVPDGFDDDEKLIRTCQTRTQFRALLREIQSREEANEPN